MYNLRIFLSQLVFAHSRGGFKAKRSQSHPKPPSEYHIELFFVVLFLSLSCQIHTKLRKNGRPGEYPGFFLGKCEQLRKKTQCIGYWIRALCLVRASKFTCRFFCTLRFFISNVDVQASAVIIEDFFIYAHYRSAQTSFIGV